MQIVTKLQNSSIIRPVYVQVSLLSSYNAVLLNRDDSGLAKRINVGGYVRTRTSSQCYKRKIRKDDGLHSMNAIADGITLSVRSRQTFETRIVEVLKGEGVNEETARAVAGVFQSNLYGGKREEADGEDVSEPKTKGKKDSSELKTSLNTKELVVLGEPEIRFLTDRVREICQSVSSPEEAKKEAESKWKKQIRKDFLALPFGAGIDAGIFGRFVSGDPEAKIDSSVHVAHSFTTHAELSEMDYFTAVDDLDPHGGSAHINAAELTSGLYYNYFVMDIPQTIYNIDKISRKNCWSDGVDRSLTARIANHLIHLGATVSPGAKLGSTAPYAYAEFVLVEIGERQPRTLGNAFLDPLRLGDGDPFEKAVDKMYAYVDSMDTMYGPHETRLVASRLDTPFGSRTSLNDLTARVEKMIIDGVCK